MVDGITRKKKPQPKKPDGPVYTVPASRIEFDEREYEYVPVKGSLWSRVASFIIGFSFIVLLAILTWFVYIWLSS